MTAIVSFRRSHPSTFNSYLHPSMPDRLVTAVKPMHIGSYGSLQWLIIILISGQYNPLFSKSNPNPGYLLNFFQQIARVGVATPLAFSGSELTLRILGIETEATDGISRLLKLSCLLYPLSIYRINMNKLPVIHGTCISHLSSK